MSESKYNDDYVITGNSLPGWAQIDYSDIDVREKIGGGGIGVIHLGYYKNKSVAIKTLFNPRVTEDVKKEYMDELLVMSKVNHSNIVAFLGASMIAPNYFFVMELCDKSVFEILHVNKEYMSEHEAIRCVTDVGYAMEYLHSLRPVIIHRDLKSHNILRDFNGVYKICDFGLVMVKNTAAGTPAYMPPELLLNKPFNKSVDVYSFGVFMNECLTGEIPYSQLDINEVRRRIINNEKPPLPSSGGRLSRSCQLITKCWHQKPECRPSFPEVVDELIAIGEEIPKQQATSNLHASGGGGDSLDSFLR